ncbi:phage major capsid protein [Methylobacterium sp. GC_Met_2]|uniref:phage major capsid protein n=1 Tax=Methylobacterium sp. GC_Met_2 TaxID=2937376 RepID=UPI00226B7B2D|nr:phage major capsid protein [Methylobacterium sp. GC_Met_2]
MDTRGAFDPDLIGLEFKDETGGAGGEGGGEGEPDVGAAVARLQAGFDTKMAEMGRDLKAANDRADALEVRMNRPGGQGAPGAAPQLTGEQKAFFGLIRSGRDALTAEELKMLRIADGPSGGYLAPPEFTTEMIRNLVQMSPVRAAARVGSMSAASLYIPRRTQNVTARWVGEIETRSPTQPQFGQIEVVAHEAAAYVDVSNALLEDAAIDIGAELAFDFGEEFGRLEGQSFILGNGVKKPLGLLADNTVPVVSVSAAAILAAPPAKGTQAPFADALVAFMYSLPIFYRSRAAWMMNGPTIGLIRGIRDSTGRFLWQESLASGEPPTLLGRPVIEAPDMPDVAAGNIPILFGDFQRGYRIYDRVGVSFLRDPYTLATVGQTRFHARMRVGAAPVQTEAYRGLSVTA